MRWNGIRAIGFTTTAHGWMRGWIGVGGRIGSRNCCSCKSAEDKWCHAIFEMSYNTVKLRGIFLVI